MFDKETMEEIEKIKEAGRNSKGEHTVSREFSDEQAYNILIRSEALSGRSSERNRDRQ